MLTLSPDDGTERLCGVLAEAIADGADTDPATMSPPLYSAVDLEALADLVASNAEVTVTFAYEGHEVVVLGDGSIRVDGTWCDSFAAGGATDSECLEGGNA